MAKKKAAKLEGFEGQTPVERACHGVRRVVIPVVKKTTCDPNTAIILRAIQAATEDIVAVLLDLPNQKLIDLAAVLKHAGETIEKSAATAITNLHSTR